MSGCSSCPTGGSCAHSTAQGGDGKCSDPMAEQDKAIRLALAGISYKIFVMSGKGGVGKSSVTVNTAVALADQGFRVGIMDVDLHGPSVPGLLGLKAGIEIDQKSGKLVPAACGPNLFVISMDSLLKDRNEAILWRGPKKTAAIRQFIADVAWGKLDFLFMDSPPGTGDEHMTVLQCIPEAQCVAVTTPQEISLADVRKALSFLRHAHADILGLVENMSGLICPNCGTSINVFKSGGGRELAEQAGIPFLGAIPLDPATVIAADLGVPVVRLENSGPAKEAFLNLAAAIRDAAAASLEQIASSRSK